MPPEIPPTVTKGGHAAGSFRRPGSVADSSPAPVEASPDAAETPRPSRVRGTAAAATSLLFDAEPVDLTSDGGPPVTRRLGRKPSARPPEASTADERPAEDTLDDVVLLTDTFTEPDGGASESPRPSRLRRGPASTTTSPVPAEAGSEAGPDAAESPRPSRLRKGPATPKAAEAADTTTEAQTVRGVSLPKDYEISPGAIDWIERRVNQSGRYEELDEATIELGDGLTLRPGSLLIHTESEGQPRNAVIAILKDPVTSKLKFILHREGSSGTMSQAQDRLTDAFDRGLFVPVAAEADASASETSFSKPEEDSTEVSDENFDDFKAAVLSGKPFYSSTKFSRAEGHKPLTARVTKTSSGKERMIITDPDGTETNLGTPDQFFSRLAGRLAERESIYWF